MWIDTHCHLDAPEFEADRAQVRARARAAGVGLCVWPAVQAADFERVRAGAREHGDAYALGIHPLYTPHATPDDLTRLDQALTQWRDDPHLVAVGEVGLDGFVQSLLTPQAWERQVFFYREQLRLARRHGLPVILHVRKSADALLKGLREIAPCGGMAHAFNGSLEQAKAFVSAGFARGFGGTLSYDKALQIRRLASELPLDALVLETDAPDIPPQWLYVTAEQRAAGQAQGRNTPEELPRIAQTLATLRGISPAALATATTRNAQRVLPRLAALAQSLALPQSPVPEAS